MKIFRKIIFWLLVIYFGFTIYFFIANREKITPIFQEFFGSSQEQVEETPNEDENQDNETIVVEDGNTEIILTRVS